MLNQRDITPKSNIRGVMDAMTIFRFSVRVTSFYSNARGDVIRMMLILNLESIEAHASEADCSRVLEKTKKRRTKVNSKCVLHKLSQRHLAKAFLLESLMPRITFQRIKLAKNMTLFIVEPSFISLNHFPS